MTTIGGTRVRHGGAPGALRRAVRGIVLGPGERGWDAARQAWNLAVDQRPVAVVRALDSADVAAVVREARRQGLRVAPQGTGHGAATLGPLEDVVLLRTTDLARVEVDVARRRASVGAGVLWGEVGARAGEAGLAGLAGSSPGVGVVGYTLGGGIGWLSRRHGLACNAVRAVELVTAAGEVLRVDHDREPELFWALRGGGGGYGVVTALEFDLFPVGELFGGMLVWPAALAAEVIHAHRLWAPSLPDAFSTSFRFLNLPPLPAVPEPLRGRAVVAVDGAFLGPSDEGAALLAPLRAVEGVIVDTFGPLDLAGLRHLHGDPEQPTAGIGDGTLLAGLTPEAADALVAVGGPGSDSPLVSLELRQLGGALSRPPAGHGALASLDAEYALHGIGLRLDPASEPRIHVHLDAVMRALAPWTTGRAYLNMADRPGDTARAFDAGTYARLRAVRGRYDADGLFVASHPVAPDP